NRASPRVARPAPPRTERARRLHASTAGFNLGCAGMSVVMPTLGFDRCSLAENLRAAIGAATVSRPARRTAVRLPSGVPLERPFTRFLCLPPYEFGARLRRWLARPSGVTANDAPFWAARTCREDLPRRSSTRRFS